jgi:hypothetical protein
VNSVAASCSADGSIVCSTNAAESACESDIGCSFIAADGDLVPLTGGTTPQNVYSTTLDFNIKKEDLDEIKKHSMCTPALGNCFLVYTDAAVQDMNGQNVNPRAPTNDCQLLTIPKTKHRQLL